MCLQIIRSPCALSFINRDATALAVRGDKSKSQDGEGAHDRTLDIATIATDRDWRENLKSIPILD